MGAFRLVRFVWVVVWCRVVVLFGWWGWLWLAVVSFLVGTVLMRVGLLVVEAVFEVVRLGGLLSG